MHPRFSQARLSYPTVVPSEECRSYLVWPVLMGLALYESDTTIRGHLGQLP
jgi:hypothetical protein